ncbi:15322_t:CDS:2, partial [Acaulospora colombiana]
MIKLDNTLPVVLAKVPILVLYRSFEGEDFAADIDKMCVSCLCLSLVLRNSDKAKPIAIDRTELWLHS